MNEKESDRRFLIIVSLVLYILAAFFVESMIMPNKSHSLNDDVPYVIAEERRTTSEGIEDSNSDGINWPWVGIVTAAYVLFFAIILIPRIIWPAEKYEYSENILNEVMAEYKIKNRKKFIKTFANFDLDNNEYMKRKEIEEAAKSFVENHMK